MEIGHFPKGHKGSRNPHSLIGEPAELERVAPGLAGKGFDQLRQNVRAGFKG